jgi:hypothetical protein
MGGWVGGWMVIQDKFVCKILRYIQYSNVNTGFQHNFNLSEQTLTGRELVNYTKYA